MDSLKRAEDVERAAHQDMYFFAYITVTHEYDAKGNHRMRINDRVYKMGKVTTTEWHPYEDIITHSDGGTNNIICATTQYWEGILPRVFRTESAERL